MTPLRIFVSSVQKEFAADRRADAVYLDEVASQTHGSVPCNPLLAEPLCVAKYIERMGTVTGDMIRLCRDTALRPPEFARRDARPESQPESRPESVADSLEGRLLTLLTTGPKSKAQIAVRPT